MDITLIAWFASLFIIFVFGVFVGFIWNLNGRVDAWKQLAESDNLHNRELIKWLSNNLSEYGDFSGENNVIEFKRKNKG